MKNMICSIRSILTLGTLLAGSSVLAGPGITGGGIGVVCRDSDRVIQSVQLLESYEVALAGKTLISSWGSAELDFGQLAKRTYNLQGAAHLFDMNLSLQDYRFLMGKIQWHQKALPFLDDLGPKPALPARCSLEQVATFEDLNADGEIEHINVDAELYKRLSSLDQAALLVHEIFHGYYRGPSLQEIDSVSVRAFVRAILATETTPSQDGVGKGAMSCTAASVWHKSAATTFFVVPNHADPEKATGLRVLFTALGRLPVVEKTAADIGFDISFAVAKDPVFAPGIAFPVMIAGQVSPVVKVDKSYPLTGGQVGRYQINIYYETLKPIRIDLIDKGNVVDSSYITQCSVVK